MTNRAVTTDSQAIYRTVKDAGSLQAIYEGSAKGDEACTAVLEALAAEQRNESHAFGIRACVAAALKGTPYATATVGCTTIDFV